MKYDIFVSYSRADSDAVTKIVNDIHTQSNASCWVDWRGIDSGDEFVDVIIRAIDAVDIVIFILSDSAMESNFVKKEIDYARNTGKRIIPMVVDGGELRGWFLFQFGNLDYIDVRDTIQYNKFLTNIKGWYGASAASSGLRESKPATSYNIGDHYNENGLEGVVFEVRDGGTHGKIVSMDQTKSAWCEAWCDAKGCGWRMPTLEELQSLHKCRDTIDVTLSEHGGDAIMRLLHWSATDYAESPEGGRGSAAWVIDMYSGYTDGSYKDGVYYIRAVAEF